MNRAGRVKGCCPGAWRPMMSGDGLIVRVRPRLGRVTRAQAEGLCDVAARHGSGIIELTNRANLQIRGIAETSHDAVMDDLASLGLLDADPALEDRRNILVDPLWRPGDLTCRLAEALLDRLADLPDLPAKFGFAIDTGTEPRLYAASADVRLERATDGRLIVRADGSATGRLVEEDEACDMAIALARWFADTVRTCPEMRRMAGLLAKTALPACWKGVPPRDQPVSGRHAGAAPLAPGATALGPVVGIAFGQVQASGLVSALQTSGAASIRVTPWRLVVFEDGREGAGFGPDFITRAGDPLLSVDACPGAPYCAEASVETRALARELAAAGTTGLHVSGCAKGCARPDRAALTLVGREGNFDIVRDGRACEPPQRYGISADTIAATILAP